MEAQAAMLEGDARVRLGVARFVATCLAAASLAGCGGAPSPLAPHPATNGSGGATLKITIPKSTATNGSRTPRFVSPATTQMTIDIQQSGASVPGYPQTVGLTPTSSGCTSTLTSTLCQLSFALGAGSYTATLTMLDAASNALSTAQNVPFTIVSGTNNTIPVVLGGIPHAVDILPLAAPNQIGSQGLYFLGEQSVSVAVYATDADDNIIIGPGAPALSASVSGASSGSGIAIAAPSSADSNTFVLSSTGFGTATLSATATPTSGSSVTTTVALNAGYYVSVLAGSATTGFVDGTGSGAKFNTPAGITYDPNNGDLYVADAVNCAIRQVTQTGTVSTIAGPNPVSCGFADGTASAARLRLGGLLDYSMLTFDSVNNSLYVSDTGNCSVRNISTTGIVTTTAGSLPPTVACGFTDGAGGSARFNAPVGIAFDAATDDLYVVEKGNCAVRQVTPAGVVATIAGANPTACGYSNGTGSAAAFAAPYGIAYDSTNGDLYVADNGNCAIRQVTTGGSVTTFAGNKLNCSEIDGTGSTAAFDHPGFIAYDQCANQFYVYDILGSTIRQVSASGVVSTIVRFSASSQSSGWNASLPQLAAMTMGGGCRQIYFATTSSIESVLF